MPGKNKTEIEEIKTLSVQSVCRKEGMGDAIRLCNHKNIGERFYYSLLQVYAAEGKYIALKKISNSYPFLKQAGKEMELN